MNQNFEVQKWINTNQYRNVPRPSGKRDLARNENRLFNTKMNEYK